MPDGEGVQNRSSVNQAFGMDRAAALVVVVVMDDERSHLRRKIEHYERLRWEFSDERLLRELDLMIEEARQRLREIEHQQ